MKVLVVFDFPSITDPSGPEADEVMQRCFDRFDLRRMEDETGAARVWVDEVYGDEEDAK